MYKTKNIRLWNIIKDNNLCTIHPYCPCKTFLDAMIAMKRLEDRARRVMHPKPQPLPYTASDYDRYILAMDDSTYMLCESTQADVQNYLVNSIMIERLFLVLNILTVLMLTLATTGAIPELYASIAKLILFLITPFYLLWTLQLDTLKTSFLEFNAKISSHFNS